MKKMFLPSLGLLTVMAACTNEELVEATQGNVASVDNLPKVELTLNVENPGFEDVESRMAGFESADGKRYSWAWNEDDIVGGALFEGADGKIVSPTQGYMTNYAFARTDRGSGAGVSGEASFNTPSPVTVGSYIFYHQYDVSSERKIFGHVLGGEDFPRVKGMVAGGDESLQLVASDASKNFYFSPLAKVALDFDKDKFAAETAELPIKMTSAYSFLRLDINSELTATSTTDYYKNFYITKVEVSTVAPADKFEAGFTLNPQTVAAIQRDLFTDPITSVLDTDVIDETTGALVQNEEDMEAYEAAFNKVRTALRQDSYTFNNSFTLNSKSYTKGSSVDVLTAVNDNKVETLVYELEEAYQLKSEEDHMVMWLPIPAGVYKNGTKTYNFNGATVTGTGALKVVVYTTEGTATFFLKSSKLDAYGDPLPINLKRDEPNRMARTLYINDDSDPAKKTNIDFYAFNQNMAVGTENEWAYALEYIEEHSKEFSNKVPQIELVGNITISELPEYKIQVYGDKTLTLSADITLDPEKTILGKGGSKFPTLKVAEGVTLDFAKEVEDLEIINEGIVVASEDLDITSLTSEEGAKIIIEEEVAVNVETTTDVTTGDVVAKEGAKLVIKATGKDIAVNSADLANKAVMTLEGNNVDVENNSTANNAEITITSVAGSSTNGIELKGTATLEVNGGDYTSEGTTEIATGATVTLNAVATNNGNVNVNGKLDADQKKYTNGQNGSINVAKAVSEGRGNTGAVAFAQFDNYGAVATEAGDLIKNYFGGTIDVKTLNNHGTINSNGELVVANGGINYAGAYINLLNDEYALIKLPYAYKNQGSIVITKPENYCMYTYFKEWNHLENLAQAGVIETTISSQEQYEAVLAQKNQYAGAPDKFTAWDVINKVNVACNLDLTNVDSKMATYTKNVVLKDNVTLSVKNGLTINELIADGASTAVDPIDAKATLNVNKTIVNASKEMTVNSNVTIVMASASTTMLDVAGTLNNYGKLNSNTASETAINTVVSGELINHGTIASAPQGNKYWSKKELALVSAINKAYWALQNTYANGGWYVREYTGGSYGSEITATNVLSLDMLISYAKAIKNNTIGTGASKGHFEHATKTYKIVVDDVNWAIPGIEDKTVMTDAVITELTKYASATALNNAYKNKANNKTLIAANKSELTGNILKEAGYNKDYMKVTLNTGVIDLQDTNSKAYGHIVEGAGKLGQLKGEFTLIVK